MRLGGAALVLGVLVAGPAFAQAEPGELRGTEFYGNIGYTQISDETELEGFSGEEFKTELGAITGRVGARFGPYAGVEGEVSFGLSEAEQEGSLSIEGVTVPFRVTTSLNNAFAAYVVGFYPVRPNFDIFARAGIGRAELDVQVEAEGFEAGDSAEGDFHAFGVGGQYHFDAFNGVRAEYTRLKVADDGGDFDTFSIAYVRRF